MCHFSHHPWTAFEDFFCQSTRPTLSQEIKAGVRSAGESDYAEAGNCSQMLTRPKLSAAQLLTWTISASSPFRLPLTFNTLAETHFSALHKMSKVNDNDRRSAPSRGAEATSSRPTTQKRKDPPGPWQTAPNHKRTNIGPPTTACANPNSYSIAAPSRSFGTKYFRISGIPQDWKEDDLLGALQTIDPDLRNQKSQLSLYPACSDSSQTALLELDPTKYFQSVGPNESTYERSFPVGKTEAVLSIDSHFYGLTPLNTPDKQIIAELVASYLPKPNPEAKTGLIAV
jgi:hypothetical protein